MKQRRQTITRILVTLGLCVSVLFSVWLTGCDEVTFGNQSGGTYAEVKETVFGSGIVMHARALGENNKVALDEMLQLAKDINANDSLSDDMDTPLKRFNQSRVVVDKSTSDTLDNWFEVDYHTYQMVKMAGDYYAKTQGYFNIAVVPLMRLWHTDSDGLALYDPYVGTQPDRLPTKQEVAETLVNCNFEDLLYQQVEDKYYLGKKNPLIEIDVGGIAKGYIADVCKEIANKYNLKSALINLSGDIYAYKGNYDNHGKMSDWTIGITDPRPQLLEIEGIGRDRIAATHIRDSGLVTSGDYERFYYFNYDGNRATVPDVVLIHIMNPKTGAPIGVAWDDNLPDPSTQMMGRWKNTGDWVSSSTVVGAEATVAEILSTSTMLMGPVDGKKLLGDLQYNGLIFTNDKKYSVTDGFSFFKPEENDGYTQYTQVG